MYTRIFLLFVLVLLRTPLGFRRKYRLLMHDTQIWKLHEIYFWMRNIHLCVRSSVCNICIICMCRRSFDIVDSFRSWLRHNGLPNMISVLKWMYREILFLCTNPWMNYECLLPNCGFRIISNADLWYKSNYTPPKIKEIHNSIMDIHCANNVPWYSYCDSWKCIKVFWGRGHNLNYGDRLNIKMWSYQ